MQWMDFDCFLDYHANVRMPCTTSLFNVASFMAISFHTKITHTHSREHHLQLSICRRVSSETFCRRCASRFALYCAINWGIIIKRVRVCIKSNEQHTRSHLRDSNYFHNSASSSSSSTHSSSAFDREN
jgi:hypothetical protein